MTLAHPGQPLAPHDLWGAWNLDPLPLLAIFLAAWAYWVGRAYRRRPLERWRDRCYAAALATLGVALVSPLDALSSTLASAHMVQHLLLMLVAAPLLAVSKPGTTLLLGIPPTIRRKLVRWRRLLRLTRRNTTWIRHPATVWTLHVGTLWFWHAAVPYDAALRHEAIHAAEHATFLITGVLFWAVILNIHRSGRPSPGFGILLLFVTAMQSVFLSALLTFAGAPWYSAYTQTTRPWGLEPLADQQLAGVIMWIPGGILYILTALTLLVDWIRQSEHDLYATTPPTSRG